MSSRGGTEGYALLDALVAILLAALVAAAVLPGIGIGLRAAGKSLERAAALIEERNRAARVRMEGPAGSAEP